jgi:hypothetical protein
MDQTAHKGGTEATVAVRRVHDHPEDLGDLVRFISDIPHGCRGADESAA